MRDEKSFFFLSLKFEFKNTERKLNLNCLQNASISGA